MIAVSRISVLALTVLLTAEARAQDTRSTDPHAWKFVSNAALNLGQSSFSSNWAGGDKGSIAWVLNSDLNAERQFSATFNLSNLLQLAYGQTARQVASPGDRKLRWDAPDKTTDLIAFESIGRFTLGAFADPYFSVRRCPMRV